MTVTLMKSKIHRATVTEANLNYIGSVTVDAELMEAASGSSNTNSCTCWTSTTAAGSRLT